MLADIKYLQQGTLHHIQLQPKVIQNINALNMYYKIQFSAFFVV